MQCVAKQANGAACSAADQCTSGNCANNTCCSSACGPCGSCGSGTCNDFGAGNAGNPSCSPYVCSGSSAKCPTTCTGDANCIGGDYCDVTGHCVAKQGNGAACSAADQCTSGNCVNSTCCSTACGPCGSCANGSGTCNDLNAGNPGAPSCAPYVCNGVSTSCPTSCTSDANCASSDFCNTGGACVVKKPNGSACAGSNQCQSGSCVNAICCNNGCGPCGNCSSGTCTNLGPGNPGNPSCSPYVCGGTTPSCPTNCGTDSNCIAGDYCGAGQCVVKQGNGTSCNASDQCSSGNCVSTVCCNGPCGPCGSCSTGTCVSLTAGNSGMPSCSPYVCNGVSVSCPTSCSGDSSCIITDYCNSANQCAAKLPSGSTCSASDQCQSAACVNTICCNAACTAGQVCNAGTCQAGCYINGTYVAPLATNPNNNCLSCQPQASTSNWSNVADGTMCATGMVCGAGVCEIECFIGGTPYPNGTLNPSNNCQSCQPQVSTSGWNNVTDGTSCGAGLVCVAGACKNGCVIGGAFYASGTLEPGLPCFNCQPTMNTAAWTKLTDGAGCGAGVICCNGACVNTQTDSSNCGKCANVCQGTVLCTVPKCTAGTCEHPIMAGNPCHDALGCITQGSCSATGICIGPYDAGIPGCELASSALIAAPSDVVVNDGGVSTLTLKMIDDGGEPYIPATVSMSCIALSPDGGLESADGGAPFGSLAFSPPPSQQSFGSDYFYHGQLSAKCPGLARCEAVADQISVGPTAVAFTGTCEQLNATVTPALASQGETVVVQVQVTNLAKEVLPSFVLLVTLPSGLSYVANSAKGGSSAMTAAFTSATSSLVFLDPQHSATGETYSFSAQVAPQADGQLPIVCTSRSAGFETADSATVTVQVKHTYDLGGCGCGPSGYGSFMEVALIGAWLGSRRRRRAV
jgi:hypothetical protein